MGYHVNCAGLVDDSRCRVRPSPIMYHSADLTSLVSFTLVSLVGSPPFL